MFISGALKSASIVSLAQCVLKGWGKIVLRGPTVMERVGLVLESHSNFTL